MKAWTPKVGDRVRVTASYEQLEEVFAEKAEGRSGRVVAKESGDFEVSFDEGDAYWLSRSHFELVDEAPARSKAETLDFMKALVWEFEVAGVEQVILGEADGCFTLTEFERQVMTEAYRAIYEKLKEAL